MVVILPNARGSQIKLGEEVVVVVEEVGTLEGKEPAVGDNPERLAMERSWPPADAEELTAAWLELGSPPIPVSPGVTIISLHKWFQPQPGGVLRQVHLAAVRVFICEGTRGVGGSKSPRGYGL